MKALVLIVEDHAAYRERLTSAAQAKGFQVLPPCERADQALDAFHTEHPDIVVIDLHLKGESDGLSLCQLMVDLNSRVRVVASSSFADPELMDRAFQSGADRCLRKPFRVDEALRLFENMAVEFDEVLS